MKEQQLSITRNDDPTLVNFTDLEGGTKALTDANFAWNTLVENHQKRQLTAGYAQTLLGLLIGSYLPALGKLVPGMAEQIKQQEEERFARIRQLNDENRKLRTQLGEKVTNEDLRERVKNLEKHLQEWWDKDGFGYMSNFQIGPYGVQATLSLGLSAMFRTEDEQALNRILEQFEFDNNDPKNARDAHLLDTRGNQVALLNLIHRKFPSALISKLETVRLENNQVPFSERRFQLRSLDVYIYDLDDFDND